MAINRCRGAVDSHYDQHLVIRPDRYDFPWHEDIPTFSTRERALGRKACRSLQRPLRQQLTPKPLERRTHQTRFFRNRVYDVLLARYAARDMLDEPSHSIDDHHQPRVRRSNGFLARIDRPKLGAVV